GGAIEFVRRPRPETERPDVADDAGDGPVLLDVGPLAEALADRILVRPELLRHRLVDEDRARPLSVPCVERAPAQDRDPQGLQVITIQEAILDERVLVR